MGNRELQIALDLDSTLAKTCDVAFDLLCGPDHKYDYGDILSWEWPLDEFGERYLHAMWFAWVLRPLDIEPWESDMADIVADISQLGEVNIVTHHDKPYNEMIDAGKKEWLAHHGIEYTEFVSVHERNKLELGYDVYIDDKPSLATDIDGCERDDVLLCLRNQPYNHTDVAFESEQVNRVFTLREVPSIINDSSIVAEQ